MRTPSNILRHELIGLECEVVKSKNKSQTGIKGKVVNETLKMIVINGKNIQKKDTTFAVKLGDKKAYIDGNYIIARPEDRIKRKISKW